MVKEKKQRKKAGQTSISYDESAAAVSTLREDSKPSTAKIQNANVAEGEDNEKINDAEIMSYFTLPAEYAFVARAISQMDGVGKGLDRDFDFISAAAPWLVEIKGGEKFVEDEAKKFVSSLFKGVLDYQIMVFKSAGFQPDEYKKSNYLSDNRRKALLGRLGPASRRRFNKTD
jgi:predicted unusual protein kinase regulating ubiquinone biosynthesis (AarF/ABC1/UbiB family)